VGLVVRRVAWLDLKLERLVAINGPQLPLLVEPAPHQMFFSHTHNNNDNNDDNNNKKIRGSARI
jgi:hypothetical protein